MDQTGKLRDFCIDEVVLAADSLSLIKQLNSSRDVAVFYERQNDEDKQVTQYVQIAERQGFELDDFGFDPLPLTLRNAHVAVLCLLYEEHCPVLYIFGLFKTKGSLTCVLIE